jgi:hypothetical protein
MLSRAHVLLAVADGALLYPASEIYRVTEDSSFDGDV